MNMSIHFRDHLYQFLTDYITQYDRSPSFAEMTHAMEISPRSKSLITRNLKVLEKEGKLILKKEGRRLLITLISKKVPLLGRISAGTPIEAIIENQFLEIQNLFDGTDRFALLVQGYSMKDEGILDGDIIICRRTERANEGDIVVALIDQQNATLKRISYRMRGMITLVPANPELKPRAYAPDRIFIQGTYIGLVRTLKRG
jgi:repressor LexA